MGIPKFFRYISERYPLTSQLIQENKIPEFDNLYLDFNGIIHNCSHPNDEDAHFRLSEEQIFTSIFTYVDHLFEKIKPKKVFFMAVDGVAPRAKMNQQRSRRFRTAKEAREVREKAEARGEELPAEKAFDSNCITPGTVFMAKLSEQLRYFVNKKITEDANWRDVRVVLSGHDVPGEGEHKIIEYIRLSKAQPGYDPNTRHCFYGLDADLMMLSLLSHDPHFALLREEVKFGPARKSKTKNAETTNYYLLHLTLLREYLDLEFRDIEPMMPFEYSLERVIDDFILIAVFIGNDFMPHLPDLHIHENGLERLFEVYKRILPSLDGYLNESGIINTRRLQVVLDEMKVWEQEIFEKEYADLNWYKGKQAKHVKAMEVARKKGGLVLTAAQRAIFDQVRAFVMQYRGAPTTTIASARLTIPNTFPAADRVFIGKLADDLHLSLTWDEYDEEDNNLVTWRLPGALDAPLPEDPPVVDGEDGEDGEWEDVGEANAAVDRVLKKYDQARVMTEDGEGDFDARYEASIKEKMDEWKRGYYKGKLEIDYDNPDEMGGLIYRYVEGLQWVMHYYFSGVPSWSWFYDYHYAPRISDLNGVDQLAFQFDLGRPFRPFEQLMGVLPAASRDLIPEPYRSLMDDPSSTILDFYPQEFDQDLNGKKQDWEAVVKIPFIDEKRLVGAMSPREVRLTEEERQRNAFGSSTLFSYEPGEPKVYPSSLPGFFPPLHRCTCRMERFDLPVLDGLHLVPGLLDGVRLGAKALAGFPSLKTLPHMATIGVHGVNVHGSESKNKSIVVHIQNPHEGRKAEDIAAELIGAHVHTGWPFLREGLVTAVSDSLFKYEKMVVVPGSPEKVIANPHSQKGLGLWKMKADQIQYTYSKRSGVLTGDVTVLVHVRPLRGLMRLDDGSFVKDFEGPNAEAEHAVQMTLKETHYEDPRFMERPAPPLSEEFPEGSNLFFLGEHAYGVAAKVSAASQDTLAIMIAFFPSEKVQNDRFKDLVKNRAGITYYPSFKAANALGLSAQALSRITSSFMVLTSDNQKVNLGLSLKFEAKALKVIGYSRKNDRYWEFSQKTIDIIKEYRSAYPQVFQNLDYRGDDMARASDLFPPGEADAKIKEIRSWLNTKGVRDFEAVSLFCDQLDKGTCAEIQRVADEFRESQVASTVKKVIVKGIPRQAVLKPPHAMYRLQHQRFALGDRVAMVQDSGGVPLSAKGTVIGLNTKSMDVLWDTPFMSGTTMGGRCAEYRGSTVEFTSCLNITDPQFVSSSNPRPPAPVVQQSAFKPRIGPQPAIQPSPGQQAVAGFRPAPASSVGSPQVHIMSNPNRGRGALANGRGTHNNGIGRGGPSTPVAQPASVELETASPTGNGVVPPRTAPRGGSRGTVRGMAPRGGPVFPGRGNTLGAGSGGRGRGADTDRGFGRGRGTRGRGRGFAAPTPAA